MPAGADAEQWMNAAAAAFKRGLPMTTATVSGMQQVMFGRGAHQFIDALQQQLNALAGSQGQDGAEGEVKQLPPAAARVQALLAEGTSLLRGALTSQIDTEAAPATATQQAQGAVGAAAQPSAASGTAGVRTEQQTAGGQAGGA